MGAILSMITVVVGDILIVIPCSILLNLNLVLGSKNNFLDMLYGSLVEIVIPMLTIFVLKKSKFNLQPIGSIISRK